MGDFQIETIHVSTLNSFTSHQTFHCLSWRSSNVWDCTVENTCL